MTNPPRTRSRSFDQQPDQAGTLLGSGKRSTSGSGRKAGRPTRVTPEHRGQGAFSGGDLGGGRHQGRAGPRKP